jgi:hypothetical protein
MSTIAGEFKGLPMAALIGGPLTAACEAQVKLANATADFIKVIGFNPPVGANPGVDEVGTIRTASFTFSRPVPPRDAVPAVAATSTSPALPAISAIPVGTMETVSLMVPMLALVQVPALSIKTVDIVFDMEVKSSSSTKSSTDEALSVKADASAKWGVARASISIQGSVAAHKENTRSTDNSAKYHVQVTALDNGPPEGLRRVLDIMNSAIVPVPA